jgi:hypothetical protein
MTVKDILAKCYKEGVELSVNKDSLNIAYEDYPSDEFIDLLKNNKSKIIEFISERNKTFVAQRPKLETLEQQDAEVYSSLPQDMLWFMSELGSLPAKYSMNYAQKVKNDFIWGICDSGSFIRIRGNMDNFGDGAISSAGGAIEFSVFEEDKLKKVVSI